MRADQTRGRPVMSTASATTIGRVAGLLVDPRTARVVALHLAKTSGSGDTLHWEDLQGFGPDAVTVADEQVVTSARERAAELTGKAAELLGKRVLDDRGDELGSLDDYDFDPDSGALLTLHIGGTDVEGSRLIGCGSYAVVVRAT